MDQDSEKSSVERRLEGIEQTLRVLCAAALAVLAWSAVSVAVSAPKYHAIFRDLLGSESKLPEFTKFVLNPSSHWLLFIAVPVVLAVVGLVAVLRLPARKPLAVYAGALVLLLTFWIAVQRALQQPMIKIIQGISGA